jgi:hypothetical protein
VSGGATLLGGASSTVTYGVPLLILIVFIFIWLGGGFPRLPPALETVPPDRRWVKGPLDRVDEGLRTGAYSAAITFLRFRVENALSSDFQIALRRPLPLGTRREELPERARALLRAGRELITAEGYASVLERSGDPGILGRWRRPEWERRERALVAAALSELETALPPMGVVP